VGYHDQRCPGLPAASGKEIEYFSARLGIKIAGWFIRQDNRRLLNQRARNGDPLLFPAGKFMGKSFFLSLKTDLPEGAADRTPVSLAQQFQGNKDVFARGQGGKQIEKLKDEADVRAPQVCFFSLRHGVECFPRYGDEARAGAVKACNNIEQRGFARTAFAVYRNKLTGMG
jgi:hypothetical protein